MLPIDNRYEINFLVYSIDLGNYRIIYLMMLITLDELEKTI